MTETQDLLHLDPKAAAVEAARLRRDAEARLLAACAALVLPWALAGLPPIQSSPSWNVNAASPVALGVWALAMAGAPLAAYGPVIGWASHLVPADLIFGKGGQHIPRGLPTAPFGVLRLRKPKSRRKRSERWGVGLRVSADNTRLSLALVGRREHSVLELAATVLLVVAMLGQAWLLLGR